MEYEQEPIYLYVKTHKITGLKYFGKTCRDPFKYKGSGLFWKRHLKKHGNFVDTKIEGTFYDKTECEKFAINFSKENNIEKSDDWANLIVENGLDGKPKGGKGYVYTEEQKKHASKSSILLWNKEGFRDKMKSIHKAQWTDARKLEQSIRLKSEYWTPERKKSHSDKMRGRKCTVNLKGIKKVASHGKNVSAALKNKPKSDAHKAAFSLSRQRNKKILRDHLGNLYPIHSVFIKKYGLTNEFLHNLNRGFTRNQCSRLFINYEDTKTLTKAGIGFCFI
jgi:hypothetical protein